ncbi:hypothetical protein TWF694_006509 [Orbilia ellipsospora]|uniref:Ankyrin repeat protein n=1 Tax=Orbilia ellipsospora TaxID=2528407 RepID=A0AAV9XLP9_9PEZI
MIQIEPVATKKIANFLFQYTVHRTRNKEAIDIRNFISSQPEEEAAALKLRILKSGKSWCLEVLLQNNLLLDGNLDIETALDEIITAPRFLSHEAINKVTKLINRKNVLNLSALDRYSDSSSEYSGCELGTKLFLLVSSLLPYPVTQQGMSQIPARKGENADLGLCTCIAQYLVDNCITDYTKALINSIAPISYRKRTRIEINNSPLKSSPGLKLFSSYQGIRLLLGKISINSVWKDPQDTKCRTYHVLMQAIYHHPANLNIFIHLLDLGANVNTVCGMKVLDETNTINLTPLYQAIRFLQWKNVQLMLDKESEIVDPELCLNIAERTKCTRAIAQDWRMREKTVEVIQAKIKSLAISHLFGTFTRAGSQPLDIITNLNNETREFEQTSISVDVIIKSVKTGNPTAFKSLLPPRSTDVGADPRRDRLVQTLEELVKMPVASNPFYTELDHHVKFKAAHRPFIVKELWEEVLELDIQLSPKISERMITPIFWSAVWDDEDYRLTSRELLQRIIKHTVRRDIEVTEIIKEASKLAKIQFHEAICRPYEHHHVGCFNRAVETAIDLGWNVSQKVGDGLTVLHFATAVSAKTINLLVKTGVLITMPRSAKAKLLVLASYYGRKELVVRLIKDRDAQLINHTVSLENFNLFTMGGPRSVSGTPSCVKGSTTALHAATSRGRKDIVKALLDAGADINMLIPRNDKNKSSIKTRVYGTALILAATTGQSEMVDLLLSYKPKGWRLAALLADEGRFTEIACQIRDYGSASG